MQKLIFIQPGYAHYRKPLFERLRETYNLTLVFISGQLIYPSYDKGILNCNTICLNSEKNIFWPFRLLRILLSKHFDVIISSVPTSLTSLLSLVVSKLYRKKFVMWTENWNLDYTYLQKPQIYRNIRFFQYKSILKGADAIVVHGNFSLNYHLSLGIEKNKIFVANHSSFDFSLYSPGKEIETTNAISQKHTILYFGRIIPLKGLDILIKAFQRLQSVVDGVQLMIIGDGEFREDCESLSQELDLQNIFFLGNVPFERAAAYYDMCDVFVLPSCLRGRSEGWGLVINEAMSLGKPIVTTDAVGAAFDLVSNGVNGYVVKNGDIIDLYLALRRILFDDQKIRLMGHNSRKIFEQFNSYDKMFEGFKNAISYACGEK